MAKLSIKAGATSQSVNIFIQDSSSTVGAGLSGLVFNTSSLIAYYTFTGASAGSTVISLVTLSAVNSAYSSGGFKEIDSTNMKGLYRLDIPNAAIASGNGRAVTIMLGGATNMAQLALEIELTGWDNQDGVHGGMSCLPNTAVTTNASLITSGTSTDQLQVSAGLASANAKQINAVSTSSVTTVNANIGETQPINFTGTSSSALVKVDVTDIAASAVSTSSAQLGVNVVNINAIAASAVTTVAAVIGTTVAPTFTGSLMKSDVTDWNASAVATPITTGVPIVDWSPSGFRQNTSQTGTASSITLDASASSTTDFYKYQLIAILGGTGAGQYRICSGYNGSTKVASVIPNWATNPDNTSKFQTLPIGIADMETIRGVLSTAGAGSVAPDWSNIQNPTTTVDLSGTTIKNTDNGVTVATNNDKTGYELDSTSLTAIQSKILSDATPFAGGNIDTNVGSRAPSSTALSTTNWTNARAGYLDNLNALKIAKATALNNFAFLMVSSSDHISPATGLTVTVQRSLDGGAFANSTNTPATEIGNGVYKINLSAADLTADIVVLKMTASGADQRTVIIATEP